jgi:hypothetical protein
MSRRTDIRTASPTGPLGAEDDPGQQSPVDPQPSEPHCAFCGHVFARGRSDKRYCSNKCRAGASMQRALAQAARQALTDPAFVDRLPTEDVRAWIDAVDLFRSRLIARLIAYLYEQGTVP